MILHFPPPADADPRYQKRNCPLEGMMYFNGELNQLEISPSVYDKLATNTDLAAAKIHEAIYYVIRNNIIKNTNIYGSHVSTPIRRLVGCLFSTNYECLFPSITKDQILESSESAYLCNNSNISYYLVKNNPVIESSRRQHNCDYFSSGGFDTSWIGLLNQVKDQSFLLPTYFVKDKNLGTIQACSKLKEFNFSTALKVETRATKDPQDGHPIYTEFKETSDGNEKYGTPICRKIK